MWLLLHYTRLSFKNLTAQEWPNLFSQKEIHNLHFIIYLSNFKFHSSNTYIATKSCFVSKHTPLKKYQIAIPLFRSGAFVCKIIKRHWNIMFATTLKWISLYGRRVSDGNECQMLLLERNCSIFCSYRKDVRSQLHRQFLKNIHHKTSLLNAHLMSVWHVSASSIISSPQRIR